MKRYNEIWQRYNDLYFRTLSKYLNIGWPQDKLIIEASVGLIPVFPRYLDSYSFALSFSLDEKTIVETTAHETLHFLWLEKWRELYHECERKEFETPYLVWKYSEMVTDPILNSKEINKILHILEKSYDNFYKISDGKNKVMEELKLIYKKNITIEEKIKKGFEYIKGVFKEK